MICFRHNRFINEKVYFPFLIVFFWTAGILLGFYIVYNAPAGYFSLMLGYCIESVSIVTRFLILLLPFIVTAILYYYKLPSLLLILVLFEAILYGFCSANIWCTFDSAGWLVRGLLLFFDIFTAPVLLLTWLRFPGLNDRCGRGYSLLSLFYAVLIFCIDTVFISPLALSLFHHS